MNSMPILDGPPVFILLAVVVGLAAYVRQVSLGAQNLIDDIERAASNIYPYDPTRLAQRTSAKLNLLRSTRKSLKGLTQVLFLFMTFVAVRVFVYARSRMGWTMLSSVFGEVARHWFDLVASIALPLLVIAMWIMHSRARRKDDKIRCMPLT